MDEAIRKFGVYGRGVIVAILDRRLDWNTRIDTIFDLTDNTGAAALDNPYKAGARLGCVGFSERQAPDSARWSFRAGFRLTGIPGVTQTELI